MLTAQRSTIDKPADREEWLAARRPYFNASATAVLFDRHPFLTAGDYATTKLTGFEQAQTRAMRRGTMLESAIAHWWATEQDHESEGSGLGGGDALFIAGCVMATPDCFWWGEPVEIKTTSERHYEPARYWLDQCQSILLCVGAPVMHLVWLDPSMDIHSCEVEPDEELQQEILDRADRFMAAIELGMVPDWVQLSYQNVTALHPESTDRSVVLDDDDLLMVQSLDMTRRIKRDAEKDESTIKDVIAKRLLDADSGVYDGHEILTWRTGKPRRELDVDMLRADHPDLVDKYTTERPGRRLMLVKLDVAAS
jgi:predicted phage-related endonuclease